MSGKTEAVDNVGRRTWDMVEYTKKRKEQIEQEEKEILGGAEAERALALPLERKPLQRRQEKVDLAATLNKRQMISTSAELADQGGYYCKVCECLLKDSSTYLSHINGRRHQRKLGMSMRAERSTLEEVRNRLEKHKRQREEQEDSVRDVAARLARYDAELRKKKKKKKKKEKEAKKQAEEAMSQEQKDMAAAGFSFSFGGSKKNN
ncbi:hypothetical protein AAMO2058_001481300 [Amorphochlora amoebiformis]|uniref:Matrin-type domain-containing protein n=1 Tax=Amorphochlora amoebiformis TaxID=1561963 RepID=A0A7S0DUG0_9EUKA|mmetsp:Transcript_9449/g.14960  ORF Transcript_9449/g.14960 Transcript_9449/m.14960 type:complete len:206 (+) Transcript_9449:67-684(+)|eukprot:10377-Amorphochlora_amoeboformis.AAC.1